MSTHDDAFTAEAKSLDYTFRAKAGTKPTWTPRWGFVTDEPRFDPRFKIGGQFGGWFYGVRAYGGHGWEVGDPEAKRGPAVNRYSDFAGALGTGVYVTGVAGTSITGTGVYGQAGDEDPGWLINTFHKAGVLGLSTSTYGVLGAAPIVGVCGFSTTEGGVAVNAWSTKGIGVYASSQGFLETAVWGVSQQGPGIMGYSGPPGPLGLPGFNSYPGVHGTSDQDIGVVGTSNPLPGVYGYSTNHVGVVGHPANPNSFGGYFVGNVMVTGNATVNGNLTVGGVISPNPKLAVMPFPDGTHRALYCMESPEVWFEDFGTAKLKRGRAVVRLDPDFTKVIKRGDYKVFPAPEGDCRGLYVRRKGAASFEVRELMGAKSSVAFSYRIVARRKDIRGYTRFAKIDARFAKIDINTRLSLPGAATRAPRKGEPPGARLREALDRVDKQVRELREKGGTSRALPKQPPPPLHVRAPRRGKGAIRRRSPNPHIL